MAHNGSLIPIPGRDIMVQAWYQGGISMFDWTDPTRPMEIAYFDRGPGDSTQVDIGRLVVGVLVQRRHRELRDRARARHLRARAERAHLAERDRRGEDGALRLPEHAGAAEARLAAELRAGAGVRRPARALERASVRAPAGHRAQALAAAEAASGTQRRDALTRLATQLDGDAGSSGDAAKVRMLATAVRDLAGATR